MLEKFFVGDNNLLNKAGIYEIINTQDNKKYVGSTGKSFKSRFKQHISSLKNKNHINKPMRYAFNKHGESFFICKIREIISHIENENQEEYEKRCLKREQEIFDNEIFCLDNHSDYYYNTNPKADRPPKSYGKKNRMFGKGYLIIGKNNPMFGKSHSEEVRNKMSATRTGENNPMFGKVGKESPNFGKHHSNETKKKISESKNISDIKAVNIKTGKEIITSNEYKLAKELGVSQVTINRRLNVKSKRYIDTPINDEWIISRIKNEGLNE